MPEDFRILAPVSGWAFREEKEKQLAEVTRRLRRCKLGARLWQHLYDGLPRASLHLRPWDVLYQDKSN